MNEKTKILILEDVPLDAELMEHELYREKLQFESLRVETREDFINELENFKPDLILADHSLPKFDGLSALKIVEKKCPQIPFIFVSGKIGEEFAVEVLREGATDYVLKNNLSKLVPAVERALKEANEQIELKMAEEALRNREEQLRMITDNMLDVVAQIDGDGTLQYVSPSVKTNLGYEPEYILGKSISELLNLINSDDLEKVKSTFRAVDRSSPNKLEFRCQHADGHNMWLESIGNPLLDDEGKIIGAIFAIRDITERKKAEKELKKYHEQLEKMVEARTAELEAINKELESFSFSVSHDLRAPLRRIDGFSQALLEDHEDKLDPQGKDYLNRVRLSAQRMAELIDDMLKLSRLTRSEMHREKVDLSEMADTIAKELQNTQPERQVEFLIEDGAIVNGDARLLRATLENLFNNAWKFTSKHPSARIEFGITEYNGKPVYFVKDDGSGFDMKDVDKLFKPFQRLHTSDEFAGSGIGLATVQRIIHRHGGLVWAEGELEKGATFYFTI